MDRLKPEDAPQKNKHQNRSFHTAWALSCRSIAKRERLYMDSTYFTTLILHKNVNCLRIYGFSLLHITRLSKRRVMWHMPIRLRPGKLGEDTRGIHLLPHQLLQSPGTDCYKTTLKLLILKIQLSNRPPCSDVERTDRVVGRRI